MESTTEKQKQKVKKKKRKESFQFDTVRHFEEESCREERIVFENGKTKRNCHEERAMDG